jgi:Cu/Ag efflux pump CusA
VRRVLLLLALAACHRAQVSERARDAPEVVAFVDWPGASPYDVERSVAIPLERTLAGLPHVRHVRTISQMGRATLSVELEPHTDLPDARMKVFEAVSQRSDLPPAALPELGAFGASGAVLRYAIRGGTPDQRTQWNDDVVRLALLKTPGIADVQECGDQRRHVAVRVDAPRLAAAGLTISDVAYALAKAQPGVLHSPPLDREAVAHVTVALRGDVPVRLLDVANVEDALVPGECTAADGQGPALVGTVYPRADGDLLEVRQAAEHALAPLQAPPGLTLVQLPRTRPVAVALDSPDPPAAIAAPIAKHDGVAAIVAEQDATHTVRLHITPQDDGAYDRVLAGVRADSLVYSPDDVVIQIFGPDEDVLVKLANQARDLPGLHTSATIGVRAQPVLEVQIDRAAAARFGVDAHDIEDAFAAATDHGLQVGDIELHASRDHEATIRAGTAQVPLTQVAHLVESQEPAELRREDSRRWVGVRVREDASAVKDALDKLALPPGYEARLATGVP